MSLKLYFLVSALILTITFASKTRNRGIKALTDYEYDVIVKKVTGTYDTKVSERTREEKVVLRKYYRWIEKGMEVTVGPSGRTIYVNNKQVLRTGEVDKIIYKADKESKSSGSRKLAGRVNVKYLGLTEKNIIQLKVKSKSLQVRIAVLLPNISYFLSGDNAVNTFSSVRMHFIRISMQHGISGFSLEWELTEEAHSFLLNFTPL